MNQTNCSSLLFLCLAVAGGGCCAATSTGGTETIVDDRSEKVPRAWEYTMTYRLDGGETAAYIMPGIGGRLMFFGSAKQPRSPWSMIPEPQTNLLWNAPAGAAPDAGWNNHGGEKTWVGDMSLWRGFDPMGRRWPPPAEKRICREPSS